jgi:hypothetical protein
MAKGEVAEVYVRQDWSYATDGMRLKGLLPYTAINHALAVPAGITASYQHDDCTDCIVCKLASPGCCPNDPRSFSRILRDRIECRAWLLADAAAGQARTCASSWSSSTSPAAAPSPPTPWSAPGPAKGKGKGPQPPGQQRERVPSPRATHAPPCWGLWPPGHLGTHAPPSPAACPSGCALAPASARAYEPGGVREGEAQPVCGAEAGGFGRGRVVIGRRDPSEGPPSESSTGDSVLLSPSRGRGRGRGLTAGRAGRCGTSRTSRASRASGAASPTPPQVSSHSRQPTAGPAQHPRPAAEPWRGG